MAEFVWFIWALAVTVSNVILSIVVYLFLSSRGKLDRNLLILRYISFYYSLGMMFIIIWASMIFMTSAGISIV